MKQDNKFDRNEAGQSIRQTWSRTVNSTEMKQDNKFDRNEVGQSILDKWRNKCLGLRYSVGEKEPLGSFYDSPGGELFVCLFDCLYMLIDLAVSYGDRA